MYDDPVLYDLRTSGIARDDRFWTRRAAELGGPILELGCGTGRVSLPLAARGHRLVGLDLCPAMLARARSKARERGLDLWLLRADMRAFRLRADFQLVILPYQSLHDLPDLDGWLACLRCAGQVLAPGGRLVVEEHDPPSGSNGPQLVRSLRHPEGGVVRVYHELRREGDGSKVAGEIRYDHERDGAVVESRSFPFLGSCTGDAEFRAIADRAGLQVERVYGGYNDTPADEDTPHRLYVLAAKRQR